MFLKTLGIKNFRSFTNHEIQLHPDLTIFVGENNGGKSNAMDAIRLLTSPLSGRREIYCEGTDIRFGSSDRQYTLETTYGDLSPAQQGRFLSAASDPSLQAAVFRLTYDESTGVFPFRPKIWAGSKMGIPEPGCQHMIRHTYLPPLRDAKRALASGNPTRIYSLLQHFLEDDKPEELAKRLGRTPSDKILDKVDSAVEIGLQALTAGVRRQGASIGFSSDEKLIDIARDLRFKLADHGITPEDLRYSGHGYANLLYMATIAVELEKVNSADLTLFLVEEPEAHLHPQLQASVLGFLEEQAISSKNNNSGNHGPAGELQVIVSTHSPNLSAWVEGEKLVVFRSKPEIPQPETDGEETANREAKPAAANTPQPETSKPEPDLGIADEEAPIATPFETDSTVEKSKTPRLETRCVPLGSLGLSPVEQRKIDRYLDVTKSAMLFGGRVLLVEGIAEALLIPVIARTHTLKEKKEDLRLFRSVVFVPIDGVDFKPYVRLLLSPYADTRIADRVVAITDGDGMKLETGKPLPGESRKIELDSIAKELGATEIFEAKINMYSLESELVRAGNAVLLKEVFLELHPRSEIKWDQAVSKTGQEQAVEIQALFKSTRKGDFAQILAEKISGGNEFNVPSYIAEAIEAIVQ